MPALPTSPVRRGLKLASLPAAYAGRTALGVGKRAGGRPAEMVANELQRRTAEQLFRVLGELKGGALKLGQAMSVFEVALPEEFAKPYRAALTALQHAAPPMPASLVHSVLAQELGAGWRDQLVAFEDRPAGAASIGQVHRARWRAADGAEVEVAVKVQYPGVAKALRSDLRQLGRFAKLFAVFGTGIDVAAIAADLAERVDEELDYELEGRRQEQFAEAFDRPETSSEGLYVPRVLAATPRVLVSEWLTGVPLSQVITDGTQEERDRVGAQLVRAVYSAPARVGLLHADPHPGNFLVLPDGRMGMLDFGSVKEMPDGLPAPLGTLAAHTLAGEGDALLASLREFGFLAMNSDHTPAEALAYFGPMTAIFATDEFHFTRDWLRRESRNLVDPRSSGSGLGRSLRLPKDYFTVHRVVLGVIGVLAQLDATVGLREEELRWVRHFREIADPDWTDPEMVRPSAGAGALR